MIVSVPYSFCLALFSQEHIVLDVAPAKQEPVESAVVQLITDIDSALRDEAPHEPPTLDVKAATWGLATLYWGCNTLVNRFETRTQLPETLQLSEPDGKSPEQHWSIDIGLRFLADLLKKTTAAAADDPLLATLLDIGARWPYSSVGTTAKWNDSSLVVVTGNRCLRHLLFDRIQQRKDTAHSQHPIFNAEYLQHIALPPSKL